MENNDFFSYQGTINRKNYAINMLIVIALLLGISLIKFDYFAPYIKPQFLYSILMFMVSFFRFVMFVSAISLVYRRIADFSKSQTNSFKEKMNKIFVFLFIFPVFYLFIIRYFIDIIPTLQSILDIIVIFLLVPLGVISTIIFGFIRGRE